MCGFRVWGLEFRVRAFRFKFWGLESGIGDVSGLGLFRVLLFAAGPPSYFWTHHLTTCKDPDYYTGHSSPDKVYTKKGLSQDKA